MKHAFSFAVSIVLSSGVAGAQNIPPSIEFRVPKPPTVAAGDSGGFLAYELYVTNLATATYALKRVEVRDGDRTLLVVEDSTLARSLARPGPPLASLADRPNLGAGARAHVFLWVPVDQRNPPASVSHRLTFGRDTTTSVVDGAITPVTRAAARVDPPLRGEWVAGNGPNNFSGHRRTYLALKGTVAIAQRFGIDFLQVDQDGRSWQGDSTKNASYFAYGDTIFSVADGRVVATKDSIPENTPRGPVARAVPIDLVTVGGNHIVVDIGNGHFAFYAHVQPGTLRVRTGERVKRGQPIGLVGNSGNSTEPHLHFHVVDGLAAGTSTLGAEGLPYSLSTFDLVGRCQLSSAGIRCSRATPVTIGNAMPLQNQLVRFPP